MRRIGDAEASKLELDAIIRELELDLAHPLIELCAEVLDNYGYNYVKKGGDELRFTIQTRDRVFRSQIIVNETPYSVARFWVFPDSVFPGLSKLNLAELVLRLNQFVALGGFGIAWDEGAVFYRNGIHFLGKGNVAAIDDLLSVAAFPLSLYHLAAQLIVEKGASPKAAVEAAAVQLEVLDWDSAGSHARKLLIHAM